MGHRRFKRNEKRSGGHVANWPDWYAEYIVREQHGEQRPD
jgi:hypothetical protein